MQHPMLFDSYYDINDVALYQRMYAGETHCQHTSHYILGLYL